VFYFLFIFLAPRKQGRVFGSPELDFGNRKLNSPSITHLISRN